MLSEEIDQEHSAIYQLGFQSVHTRLLLDSECFASRPAVPGHVLSWPLR